jgi:hypothetical protein
MFGPSAWERSSSLKGLGLVRCAFRSEDCVEALFLDGGRSDIATKNTESEQSALLCLKIGLRRCHCRRVTMIDGSIYSDTGVEGSRRSAKNSLTQLDGWVKAEAANYKRRFRLSSGFLSLLAVSIVALYACDWGNLPG